MCLGGMVDGDVSHMETSDEITTHGECVQPL
jgi:hypothetical protein